MPLTKFNFKPGINKQDSDLASEGMWKDSDMVRFRYGQPEKIGGWKYITTDSLIGAARGQFAWTDATNTGDFITPGGENLKGSKRSYSPEIAGSFGLSYDSGLSNGWRYNISTDARYSDEYGWGTYIDSPMQDSFWINDVYKYH